MAKSKTTNDDTDATRWSDGAEDMIERAFAQARLPLPSECAQHPQIDAGDKPAEE